MAASFDKPPKPSPPPPEAIQAANLLVAQVYRRGKTITVTTIADHLARQGHRPPDRKRYSTKEVQAMLGGWSSRR